MSTPENRENDRRSRVWRFSPEINTGHLLTILTISVGAITAYGTYRSDQTKMQADIDMVRIGTARDRVELKETVTSFNADIKELKTAVGTIGENVAVLKATQAAQLATQPRAPR